RGDPDTHGGELDRSGGLWNGERLGKGLWIQMSPPTYSVLAGVRQRVTDRRVEPVADLYCEDSNWPRLSSAWANE
ncbi:hypothetical protein fugu_017950, partial [Takifugu bimaculatus]